MKAAIFNPYLDTLGGGERYTMTFAEVLAKSGYKVDIQWANTDIRKKLEGRFGKNYSEISFISDVKRGDGYDVCFWLSDGSVPTLRARKNFLHFQVPFHHIGGNSLLNKMKLFRIDKVICNSLFTKKMIDAEYGVDSIVIYPPVATNQFKSKRKENIILAVSRFSQLKQSKHQDILIKAFKRMIDNGLTGWKLILAGGTEIGVADYVEELRKMSNGYPIEIIESPGFRFLADLYGKSKIFWTASGLGVDEEKNPEGVEHFGISVVEAMSAGSVPFAFKAGGHKETIEDGVNGFLWKNISELILKTKKIIGNPSALRIFSARAKVDSQKYSEDRFGNEVERLL